jgi:hypothetical protein
MDTLVIAFVLPPSARMRVGRGVYSQLSLKGISL